MRLASSSLLGALAAGLIAACAASPNDPVGAANAEIRESDIATLVFIVWSCEDLGCQNLETGEIAKQKYTACAAVEDDALKVGIQVCEGRKRTETVMSNPATCRPLGTPCPVARAAYNWDDVRKQRVDELDDDVVDAGKDASGP